jgi:hypothetical protein
LLITWLTQPIKEEVVDSREAVDVAIGVVLSRVESVASDAVGAVVAEATEVTEVAEDVQDAPIRRKAPGFP